MVRGGQGGKMGALSGIPSPYLAPNPPIWYSIPDGGYLYINESQKWNSSLLDIFNYSISYFESVGVVVNRPFDQYCYLIILWHMRSQCSLCNLPLALVFSFRSSSEGCLLVLRFLKKN